MYLMDTNVCIRLLNRNGSPAFIQKFSSRSPTDFRLCSVVKYELYYGAYKSSRKSQNLEKIEQFFDQFQSLALDDESAKLAGKIRSQLTTQGIPIGPNDVLIAAIALANNLTLITHNTREFGRVGGLQLEDWEI
ncbi:MAG: type II toxin-antitoxin system VapC family toxin [Leptolyngbya sp.]|nr:type II toxin-antitoxin system VapC family toxin [Leptolyngbya sp.]